MITKDGVFGGTFFMHNKCLEKCGTYIVEVPGGSFRMNDLNEAVENLKVKQGEKILPKYIGENIERSKRRKQKRSR